VEARPELVDNRSLDLSARVKPPSQLVEHRSVHGVDESEGCMRGLREAGGTVDRAARRRREVGRGDYGTDFDHLRVSAGGNCRARSDP
jgi:hypothetical protein